MDNHQDDETVRRWKTDEEDRVMRRETMMNWSEGQAVEAGLPPAQIGARQAQRRQIESRGHDHEDDDLRIIEETETEPDVRPVRKKKRAFGR